MYAGTRRDRSAQPMQTSDRMAPRRTIRWVALLAALGTTTDVAAEPDYRPSDRFFFGFAGGIGERDPMSTGAYAPTGSYETSFWPNDHVGLATIAAVAGDQIYDAGGQLVLGVPLRWVQPYAGAMAGWRTTPDAIRFRVHAIAGLNAYASRNLRVFVELRDPEITLIGTDHAPSVVAGLRWSPDWFHRARTVTKIDTIWWSTLLAAGLWTGVTLAR